VVRCERKAHAVLLTLINIGKTHQTRLQETFYEHRDCEEDQGTG
jgi:hypothetical protein